MCLKPKITLMSMSKPRTFCWYFFCWTEEKSYLNQDDINFYKKEVNNNFAGESDFVKIVFNKLIKNYFTTNI